jgi:hypothetical protein
MRRPRLQFSIRSIFGLTTIVAMTCAWQFYEMPRSRAEWLAEAIPNLAIVAMSLWLAVENRGALSGRYDKKKDNDNT